jgi:hypothetical protein
MNRNNIIADIEEKVYNRIEKESIYISDKNSLFNYTFNHIINKYFNSDVEVFNQYLDAHYFPFLSINNKKIDIYKEYVKIINHIIIRYHCIPMSIINNSILPDLKESDWEKMFNISLEEISNKSYHNEHSYYELKIRINTPEIIDIISSKILKNFKLKYDGSICDNNGRNIMNMLFDVNFDNSMFDSIGNDLMLIKSTVNDIKDIINKIVLHNF